MPDLVAGVTNIATSQKAVIAASAAVGVNLAYPLLAKIPGIQKPVVQVLAGLALAYFGHTMQGKSPVVANVLIGVGLGLAARGVVVWVAPKVTASR